MTPRMLLARCDAIERWFQSSARDLPWRRHRAGYTALVAESMLQQTQVDRVVDRYVAFLVRFPSVHDLANASEQSVLAAWQGLGYYRRAMHLHQAARIIVEQHDGIVPLDVMSLRGLPGVGRYTAGAIASIVGGHRVPLVDGNVHRVLARLFADRRSPSDRRAVEWAWKEAERLVERSIDPGIFNEGLMELGATICTPRKPLCGACPMSRMCEARKTGRPEQYPKPKTSPVRLVRHHHVVVVQRAGRVLLEQRPADGLWAGMWQAPTVEMPRPMGTKSLAAALPFRVSDLTRRVEFRHDTTHRRIEFHVFIGRTRKRSGTWRSPDDVADLPMSNAQKRIMDAAAGMLVLS